MLDQSSFTRYKSRYPRSECPNLCGSFIDATPSYLRNPAVPQRIFNLMNSEQRLHAKFLIVLRDPISRDRSWYSVGEGIQSNDWWEKRHRDCGGDSRASAQCYHDSVTNHINSWDRCMRGLSLEPCRLSKAECIRYLKSNIHALIHVYDSCSHNNRLADGIYAGQLSTWLNVWPPEVYASQFLVLSSLTLSSNPADSIRKIMAHVSTHKLNNSIFVVNKEIPVENSTRKKKKYLKVGITLVLHLLQVCNLFQFVNKSR